MRKMKNTHLSKAFGRMLLLFVFILPSNGYSQVIADTPCDPQYYESLSARAWLEAQREITQNQNLILKPDSVLEYTCFDRLVREYAEHADQLLSETQNFSPNIPDGIVGDTLQDLIGISLETYIMNNFASLGNPATNLLSGHPAATGISHAPQSISDDPTAFSCDIMARVWQAAKCINFATNPETDGFFTFAEYAESTEDRRQLPTACLPPTTSWQENLTVALTAGPWTNDPVQTYFSLTDAEDCAGANCQCTGAPIPTGVTIRRTGLPPYQEHFCVQPGCRFVPPNGGGATGGQCIGR